MSSSAKMWWGVAGICLAAFVTIAILSAEVFEHVPHSEDEVAYIFQAKVFAQNRLAVPFDEFGVDHTDLVTLLAQEQGQVHPVPASSFHTGMDSLHLPLLQPLPQPLKARQVVCKLTAIGLFPAQ